jgi:hypothetical protein
MGSDEVEKRVYRDADRVPIRLPAPRDHIIPAEVGQQNLQHDGSRLEMNASSLASTRFSRMMD